MCNLRLSPWRNIPWVLRRRRHFGWLWGPTKEETNEGWWTAGPIRARIRSRSWRGRYIWGAGRHWDYISFLLPQAPARPTPDSSEVSHPPKKGTARPPAPWERIEEQTRFLVMGRIRHHGRMGRDNRFHKGLHTRSDSVAHPNTRVSDLHARDCSSIWSLRLRARPLQHTLLAANSR